MNIPPQAITLSLCRPPKEIMDEAIEAATVLKALLDAKANPVIFNGDRYLEYEDWQTVARFYGVTARVRESKPVKLRDIVGFSAFADALLVSTGQVISSADAMCLTDEPYWRSRPKYVYDKGRRTNLGEEPVPLFQLRSMAQTRACAKALRNVMAWVVVLAGYKPTPAEELTGSREFAKGNCYTCGWEIYSAAEIADSRREFAKTLCKVCVKHEREAKLSTVVNDPNFVQQSVDAVKAKIKNGKLIDAH